MDHPSEEVLARVAEGALRSEGELAEHLRTCATCSAAFSALSGVRSGSMGLETTAFSRREGGGPPKPHQVIGRYQVERLLGEGAMGQVFEALDPELNRRVAVKVVRGAASVELRARLLREARTAAALRHPNIVTVHDAGTIDEEVFIAMELVPGGSLRGWLAQPRTWREVLRVFVGAGRGLAAVHDAGLVHRDFKPDNVLLDTDGTARVSDFGLVGAEPGVTANMLATPEGKGFELTRTGTLMGTPAYMSPELFKGAAATPRSDQFAFCVALFEALARERPFRATTFPELREEVLKGEVLPMPSSVPRWLERVVRRGLSVDADRRFGSMQELVELLEKTPVQRSRRVFAASAGLAALGLVGISTFIASGSDARRCREGAARVDGVWSPARRAALAAHISAIPSPYAKDTVRSMDEAFDGFANAWRAMQIEACEATRLRGTQSDQLLDLRVQCLDARLAGFGAAISTLEQLEPDELENAQRVLRLGGLAACADTKSLANTTPPPASPEAQAKLVALRAALAEVSTQSELGRATTVIPTAVQAVADAKQLGWRPLEAEALLVLGTTQQSLATPDAALTLADAALAAEAGRSDPTLVAALELLAALKTDTAPKEARGLIKRAHAVLERISDEELAARVDLAEARVFLAEATPQRALELMDALRTRRGKKGDHLDLLALERRAEALHDLGQLKEALQTSEEVERGREALHGREHPLSLTALKNVAAMKNSLGDFEGARAVLTDVLERSRASFGDAHPTVARALVNLGNSWFNQGKSFEAAAQYEKALAMLEKLGPGPSTEKARAMGNLASAYADVGRRDEAIALQEKSVAMLEQIVGPEHPQLAFVLSNLAQSFSGARRLPDAITTLERAVAIQRKALPKNHPDLAHSLFLMADLRNQAGESELARGIATEALGAFKERLGTEASQTVAAEAFIAGLDLSLGKVALALPVFERVQTVYDKIGNVSTESALNHLRLAQALAATKGARARICEEAQRSRSQYVAAGVREDELGSVDKVLRANRCP